MKIQLRNYYCCDSDVVEVAEGSIRDDRNCEGRTEIAGVASSGHVSKGIPQEPRRARHFSAHQSGNAIAKGDQRRPRMDGRAVLRPHSTCEGGEPQGFRKERPRYPLEGRGNKRTNLSIRKHSRGSDLGRYVHAHRQTN